MGFFSRFPKMLKQKPCKLGNKIYFILFQIVINKVVDAENRDLRKIFPKLWAGNFSKSETVC